MNDADHDPGAPAAADDRSTETRPDLADAAPSVGASPSFGRHPVLVYTLQRVGVLLGVGVLLYLLGLRGVWLILWAFLVSGVVSVFLLSRSREGASWGITGAVSRVNQRIEAAAAAEDVDDYDDLGPAGPTSGPSDDDADAR